MRKSISILVGVGLMAVMLSAVASHEAPTIEDWSQETNQPSFWEVDSRVPEGTVCSKIEPGEEEAFLMPAPPTETSGWVLLVVKQGQSNFIYELPSEGHTYPSVGQNAPGWSHVILCSHNPPPEETTTTTEQETTTTTVQETTTTTEEEVTTTTQETTTTSEAVTTTTEEETTTTTTKEDPATETEREELPFTGIRDWLIPLGLFTAVLGGGLVAVVRFLRERVAQL